MKPTIEGDPRRYNAPTAPEIAVLMPGDGYTEGVATRDIVLHARPGGLKRTLKSIVHTISSFCFIVSFRI